MIREKSLQIVEVELDRSLPLQIGIILDHIAFIHAVYHLDRIPAQLDTEDLDPEKGCTDSWKALSLTIFIST